jgi:hypothetical protein
LLKSSDADVAHEAALVAIASDSLKGQEIDPDICEIANATLSARLPNVVCPLVELGDSIAPSAFNPSGKSRIHYGTHLCAATNPPFGTKTTIKDVNILRDYQLARVTLRSGLTGDSLHVSSRPPDILLLEQNVRLLKPGYGRLAIVVPYQILSGPQTLFVRQWLLRETDILAVIDLPAETFQPHTGTKTALLIVRRRFEPLKDPSGGEDHQVFMSIPRWIGHDRRGNPVFERRPDGTLSGEILTDFNMVERAHQLFLQGDDPGLAHSESFATRLSSVTADPQLRLNALFHRPGRSGPMSTTADGGWSSVKIRDVVKRIFFPTRFKRSYVDYYNGAIPFLGGSNISQLTVTTEKWIRHDDPKLNELIVRAGWILVTRSGSTGIVSSVPKAWDGVAMSEHVIRIEPDSAKLDPGYLQAFLRTPYAQEALSRGVFGSVIDEIAPDFIGDLDVPIPNSQPVLSGVSERIRHAESARDSAIHFLNTTVEELNDLLCQDTAVLLRGEAGQFDPSD